jgi:hypothetical protein
MMETTIAVKAATNMPPAQMAFSMMAESAHLVWSGMTTRNAVNGHQALVKKTATLKPQNVTV